MKTGPRELGYHTDVGTIKTREFFFPFTQEIFLQLRAADVTMTMLPSVCIGNSTFPISPPLTFCATPLRVHEKRLEGFKEYFSENDMLHENILACAIDGLPSITSIYRIFIAY